MKLLNIDEIQELQLQLMKELHGFFIDNGIRYYLIAGSALGAKRHEGFIPWDDDIDVGLFRDDYEKFLLLSSNFNSKYEIKNWSNDLYCDYGLTRIYFKNTLIDNPSIKNTKLDKRMYLDIFPLDNVPQSEIERNKYEIRINRYKKLLDKLYVRVYDSNKIKLFVKKFISLLLTPFKKAILCKFDQEMNKYRKIDTPYVCSLCSQYNFNKQVMNKKIYGIPCLHVFEEYEFYVPERLDEYLQHLYGPKYMEVPKKQDRRTNLNIYIDEAR